MFYDEGIFLKYYNDLSLAAKNNPEISEMRKAMDVVDLKCSSLLTHVSVMIAASVFLQTQSSDALLMKLFLIETSAYIFVTLILLFCINFIGAHTKLPSNYDINKFYAKVAWRRILLYRISLHATIAITVALILTLGAKFARLI